mgnify:CR=1 FL=1
MQKFETLSRTEQGNFIIPILIKVLRKLGGQASRNELKNTLISDTDEIPEEFVNLSKQSKNGNKYQPFAFTFNFAIKDLIFADFLNRPGRGEVELTEKGRVFDIDNFDVNRDVLTISRGKWREKSEENKINNFEKASREFFLVK